MSKKTKKDKRDDLIIENNFHLLVMKYVKQGVNRLRAIDLAAEEINRSKGSKENVRKENSNPFNSIRLSNDKTKGK